MKTSNDLFLEKIWVSVNLLTCYFFSDVLKKHYEVFLIVFPTFVTIEIKPSSKQHIQRKTVYPGLCQISQSTQVDRSGSCLIPAEKVYLHTQGRKNG